MGICVTWPILTQMARAVANEGAFLTILQLLAGERRASATKWLQKKRAKKFLTAARLRGKIQKMQKAETIRFSPSAKWLLVADKRFSRGVPTGFDCERVEVPVFLLQKIPRG